MNDEKSLLVPEVVSAVYDMIKGEMYQMEFSNIDAINREHYFNIIKLKTAEFMGTCAKLGAMKASMNAEDYYLLYNFGFNLGNAYQIVDDTLDYIEEKFTQLSKNIQIISPNTDISPYSLYPFIDVGLVYNGTMGLEMAIYGFPVVVAGNAHYGKKGFTYDVFTKDDFSELIFTELKNLPNQKKLARIYGYFHFIKKFLPRTFLYANSFLDVGWNINSFEGFTPGKNKYLDHICNYIINNGVFQDW